MIQKRHWIRSAACALLLSLSLLGTHALAAESRGRMAMGLGLWSGHFTQSANGQSVSLNAPISPGATLQLGLNFYMFFIEYNLAYLASISGNFNNSSYRSFFGGNFGIDLPMLPFEIYVGMENGTHQFSSGSQPIFHGTAYKLGTQFVLKNSATGKFAIQGEFRRHFISEDGAGKLPTGFSTISNTYFIGASFGIPEGKN